MGVGAAEVYIISNKFTAEMSVMYAKHNTLYRTGPCSILLECVMNHGRQLEALKMMSMLDTKTKDPEHDGPSTSCTKPAHRGGHKSCEQCCRTD